MKRSPKSLHRSILSCAAVLGASLLLGSCASAGPRIPGGTPFARLGPALDRKLAAVVGDSVPALQAALVEDGRIVYERAFGLADREARRPAAPSTLFQVASISKSVTAWAVLRLAQEGRLDLDAPVGGYLTRWSLPPSSFEAKGVTARRILSHSAGLSVHGFPGIDPGLPVPSVEDSLSGNNTGKGVIDPDRAVRLVAAPGGTFSYSGGGYTLLQLLVEELSGRPFSAYMEDAVLKPCGMASSSFDYGPELAARVAGAYDFLGKRLPNYLYAEKAAAGLYSTAGDLARLLCELYASQRGGGRVLDRSWASLLATPLIEAGDGSSMALGYFVSKSAAGGRIASHTGSNRGWYSWYAINLDNGRGIVVLANSEAAFSLIKELSESSGELLR